MAPPTPTVADETIALIRAMAPANHTWSAKRIRGEMLKPHVRDVNELRPHQGIHQRLPAPSELAQQTQGMVRVIPILGWLTS